MIPCPRFSLAFTLSFAILTACGSPSQTLQPGGGGASASAGAGQSAGGTGTAGSSAAGSVGGSSTDIGPQQTSEKLDVLFVVDNSSSMAGKQSLLASAVPGFVTRLSALSHDIHFGVITTSLGAHGGNAVCQPTFNPHNDDGAQLVPSKRDGVPSYMGSGYLSFDAAGLTGVSDAAQLSTDLTATIRAAGEDGCGYEAPLEAMYRFLIDPEPPLSVTVQGQTSVVGSVNDALLAQRSSFLRPDSSLAVLILSDENDCSIIDSGQGWFMASSSRMPLATSACATNPTDPCCRSCALVETAPPSGCAPIANDSVCQNVPAGQTFATWDALHDSLNLRCFDQQRRFGFDLLYPVQRYRDGLSNSKIQDRAGTLVDNPLFAARDGKGPRSASQVSLSVLIGAPWQDLATPASLSGATLDYLDGAGLESAGRWPLLVGDASKGQPPSDPFMVESIEARTGTNPLTQTPLSPASSTNPTENPINGHEQNVPNLDDLQYACTFRLATPIMCSPGQICECAPDKTGSLTPIEQANSPLCQPPTGGQAGTTQYYGKGYPGTRELQLVQGLETRALAASVCLKDPSEVGYTAALGSFATRIAVTLK